MSSSIGFHILYDAIDSNPNPTRARIEKLKPRVINIVGGARKTQAFAFALDLHAKYPDMRIIWRSWPDDGNHVKETYKLIYHRDPAGNLSVDDASGCERWIDDNKEALSSGLTVLTDNESMRADLDVYAEWQAQIMRLTGKKGWKVAVGRFATGNPHEDQYQQLDRMFEALNEWKDFHCFSPNEYMSKDPTRNGGNVKRYELAINRAKQIGAWPFPVNIGEFGILAMEASGRLDPYAGYHDPKVGLSGKDAARFSVDQWKTWYRINDIDACIYCVGGDGSPKWDRCRIDNDDGFMDELISAFEKGELAPMVSTNILPQAISKPTNAGPGRNVICKKFRNIRSGPSTRYHDDGDLPVGAVATVYDQRPQPEKLADGSTVNWWWMESENGNGWIQSTGWVCENVPDPAPAPVDPPIPVPPVETWPPAGTGTTPAPEPVKLWSFGIKVKATESQIRLMQMGFEKIMEGIGYIGLASGAVVDIEPKELTPEAVQ